MEKANEGGAQGSESKAEESKTTRQRLLRGHNTDDTESTLEFGVTPSKKRNTFAYGRDPDRPEYVWPGVRHRELLKPPLSKERKQYYRQFDPRKWVPYREFDP